jgi:transcriptional regulator with XRE-family HTH domain
MIRTNSTQTTPLDDLCLDLVSFGEYVEDMMKDQTPRVTGKELAERLGYAPGFIVRLLRNEFPNWMGLEMVQKIAKVLNKEENLPMFTLTFGCTVLKRLGITQ